MISKPTQSGFSLVEALLAIAAFSVFATGLIGVFVYGRQGSVISLQHNRAESLANESMAALRSIRDRNFSSLSPGTYGLSLSGGVWTLTGSPDVTEGFTRTVVITSPEANIRQAVVTLSWQQTAQRTGSLALSTYLSNWRTTVVPATSWTTPVQEAVVDVTTNNDGLKVAAAGNYVYLVRSGGTPDFVIINVTNPASPSVVGSLDLAGNPTNIAVSGNYAYVGTTDDTAEFIVVNVTTPSAPAVAGTVNLTGSANTTGVAVSGNFAYVTRVSSGDNEFYIINVTVPTAPVLAGSLNLASTPNEVAVSGNFAYLASDTDTTELIVVNVTNPALPSVAGSADASGNNNASTVTVYGTTAVIGRAGGDVLLYNVTSPSTPTLIGSYNHGANINDVSADTTHNYLFVATASSTGEFAVINATTPATPTLLSQVNLVNTPNGVFYESVKDRAYLASPADTSELFIFRPGP